MNYRILELTKENESNYLDQVAQLEEVVLDKMEKEGRVGQLFTTGRDDISDYIHSENNTVMVATDLSGKVLSAAYITQGQKFFTYNDITKYFKFGNKYKQAVRESYSDIKQYKDDLLSTYALKVRAFEDAKLRILAEHPEFKNIQDFLSKEMAENGFHEKSELREKINQYMAEFIDDNCDSTAKKKYEHFYWFMAFDICSEFGGSLDSLKDRIADYEKFMQSQIDYESILKKSGLKIYEIPNFDVSKYYSANPDNSIEIDTYLTSPSIRSFGMARIIVYEGIKKHIERHFRDPNNQEIFLCSTLHRDNLPSKYVSEFFGLTDSLYVNRRQGRDREVHICKISRDDAMKYLSSMADKLAVLYGYNPNDVSISYDVREKVLREQILYERNELKRLQSCRTCGKLKGPNLRFVNSKAKKLEALENKLKTVPSLEKDSSHEIEI